MSIWNSYLQKQSDVVIVGAGFTGLNTALSLKEKYPNWSVTILEALPFGGLGSTNNAGFACFGSAAEIYSDLQKFPRNVLCELIKKRYQGIQRLASMENIDAKFYGGYDVFLPEESTVFESVLSALPEINDLVYEATEVKHMFKLVDLKDLNFSFSTKGFKNEEEFQINPGMLHYNLTEMCIAKGIRIINNMEVKDFQSDEKGCLINTTIGEIWTKKLVFCTNGLTQKVIKEARVKPARGQVLFATVDGGFLPKGNFHATEGYYYFRNFANGVLLGGGRQTDLAGETSSLPITTTEIQKHLEDYLGNYILPNQKFKITHRWAGIMGMGEDKFPKVEKFDHQVYGAYAFGGMGVALSYTISQDLVKLISNDV